MLPDFIIAGAPKSGTTTLVDVLRKHPIVFFPKKLTAETHFFDNDKYYQKGVEFYKQWFKEAKPNQIVGEKTPAYSFSYVPERIAKYLPNVKLIFVFRNPADRAYSHWLMYVWRGVELYSFEKALSLEERRLKKHPMWGYKEQGKYIKVLENYLKYFPKEQLLILIFEELISDPNTNLKRITDFLQIEKMRKIQLPHKMKAQFPKFKILQYFCRYICDNIWPKRYGVELFKICQRFNKRKVHPSMDKNTREYLIDYFKDYNTRLEEFLGREIVVWHK